MLESTSFERTTSDDFYFSRLKKNFLPTMPKYGILEVLKNGGVIVGDGSYIMTLGNVRAVSTF